jgi:hypothetical protein
MDPVRIVEPEESEMTAPTPKPQRRTLILLFAMFFLPIAVSFLLYYGTTWRPGTQVNHGELIQPAQPLPPGSEALRGKWALVYVGDGACDDNCQRSLVFARQTRLSLNQEMARLERALLAISNCCDRAYLEREHEGIEVIDASREPGRTDLLAAIPSKDREHSLYVIDPLGNVVMRYDTREGPRGLLTDLKKLLKLSHIG